MSGSPTSAPALSGRDAHPTPPELKIALCLSGGGLRATFFHLGVIQSLREADLLRRVTHVCSVSGGSILAGHLVLNWDRYVGTNDDFVSAQNELMQLGSRDLRGRVVRRWLLVLLLLVVRFIPAVVWRRTQLLEREYARLFHGALLHDLNTPAANPRPDLHILATSFTTGNLCSFSKDGFWIDSGNAVKLYPTGLIPLSLAVAASSAFPPLFPPVMITRKMLDAAMVDLPYDPEYLSDGGVFDNLGFEKFLRLRAENNLKPDCLLLSDAGAQFDWDIGARFAWIISRTVRSTDILMKRVADSTLSLASSNLNGIEVVHIPISALVPVDGTARTLPIDLQKRLSKVRTDLDRFSPVEIDLLSRHGHEVSIARLQRSQLFANPTYAEKLKEANAFPIEGSTFTPEQIQHAAVTLDKSELRHIGLWNARDWTSFALAVWLAILFVLANSPFLFQTYRLHQLQAQTAVFRCDQLAAELQNSVGLPGVEYDKIDTQQAIPTCESALRIDPDNPRLMDELARSLDLAGRHAEAVSWYSKAVAKGWAWAENNLGVLYLEGRTSLDGQQDVPVQFTRGVALLRAAAEKNNQKAIANYAQQDLRLIFNDSPDRVTIVERALVDRGFLQPTDVTATWNSSLDAALDAFKRSEHLGEGGVTLRVLDRLGVIVELSHTIRTGQ
jgi:predicted acylesterase/phospholipase RssA/tetratricopeptide (TPR) repeat protein